MTINPTYAPPQPEQPTQLPVSIFPVINGRQYPLWSRFVAEEAQFIGGTMQDFGDSMDRAFGAKPMETVITGIELTPNGTDSAYFTVTGKDFDCGFDVEVGGITAGDEDWVTFLGYGGHTWRIKAP